MVMIVANSSGRQWPMGRASVCSVIGIQVPVRSASYGYSARRRETPAIAPGQRHLGAGGRDGGQAPTWYLPSRYL